MIEDPGHHLLDPGDVVDGRYRVRRFLGEGGFAEVYEAEHVHIERRVALKLLKLPSHGSQRQVVRERFKREAALAARIEHPGVATVYDFGFVTADGAPYIAMELLQGVDVGDELAQRGAMQPERALRLFRQALEALAAAHALGVVHKDLKPSNLFLVRPGEAGESVRVLDFGIARLMERGHTLTQTGGMAGTPQYMAPEYIEQSVVSGATDVYQMGLILVELLTGEMVVKGNNPMHCLILHSDGNLGIPAALLDSPLGPIIRTATARDPARRYPDAATFLAALADVDPAQVPRLGLGPLAQPRVALSAMLAATEDAPPPTTEPTPQGLSFTATASLDAGPTAPALPPHVTDAHPPATPRSHPMDRAPLSPTPPSSPAPLVTPSQELFVDEAPSPSIVVARPRPIAGLVGLAMVLVLAASALIWTVSEPATPRHGEASSPDAGAAVIEADTTAEAHDAGEAPAHVPTPPLAEAPVDASTADVDDTADDTADASTAPEPVANATPRRRRSGERPAGAKAEGSAATPDGRVATDATPPQASATGKEVTPPSSDPAPTAAPTSQPVRKRVGKLN